jgi:hypothetical protein
VQWPRVEASAGDELIQLSAANNWFSDAPARQGGDWAFSEPTPQLAITGVSTTDPALCKPLHPRQLLGFEDMILLRAGGLAASPLVRYTLETAEQCLALQREAAAPGGLTGQGPSVAVVRPLDEVSISCASCRPWPFRTPGARWAVDLDRHPAGGGPRFDQFERCVRAGAAAGRRPARESMVIRLRALPTRSEELSDYLFAHSTGPCRDEFRPGRGSILCRRTSYDAARHETPRRTP